MNKLSNYKLRSEYQRVLRYEAEFTDRQHRRYVLHILHEGKEPTVQVRLGAKPIVISRESERLGGLIQSRAVVTLLSHQDGLFRHLHTMPEGAVKLVVWQDGELYWIGTLDPESYEEGYNRRSNYLVDLTFSDFGCAKRLSHRYNGFKSLDEWIRAFVSASVFHSIFSLGAEALPIYLTNDLINKTSLLAMTSMFVGPNWNDLEDEFGSSDPIEDLEYIVRGAFASSRAFYKDERESLSIYDSLDGLLRSLGLRLEQRAGKFIIYDIGWLLHQEAKPLVVRGNDATFVADESYNALNVEVDARQDAAKSSYNPDKVVGERRKLVYPRTDLPDDDAYALEAVGIPHALGAYNVRTIPGALGEKEEFIALCIAPTTKKIAQVYASIYGRYYDSFRGNRSATFADERNYGNKLAPDTGDNTTIPVRNNDYDRQGNGWEATFTLPSSISPTGYISSIVKRPAFLGIGRWANIGSEDHVYGLFSPFAPASTRAVIARLELPVTNAKGLGIRIDAKLFVSFQPSIYQTLSKEFAIGTLVKMDGRTLEAMDSNQDNAQKLLVEDKLPLHDVDAMYIALRVRAGDYILDMERISYIETYRGDTIYYKPRGYRYVYKWKRYSNETKDCHIYVPFGAGDGEYRFGSWTEIDHLVEGLIPDENGKMRAKKRIETNVAKCSFSNIPDDAGNVQVEFLSQVIFGSDILDAWMRASRQTSTPISLDERVRRFYDDEAVRRMPLCVPALISGIFIPSYVLLKDLSISTVEASGNSQLEDDKLKKTAILNEHSYEVLDLEPLLSCDPEMPAGSPVLIIDRMGHRINDIRRIDWHKPRHEYANPDVPYDYEAIPLCQNTTELLAIEAFSHYGMRKHNIEGRFQSVDTLALLEYAGHRYMVLNEEVDLRACASEYTLAEISPSNYKPATKLGMTEDGEGGHFVIE